MYLIAGLGNPGSKYDQTRHNVGFQVLDRLAERNGISVNHKKFKAIAGKGMIDGQKVILIKPQTFMNLSGESIHEFVDYYDLDPRTELIVICDDINLSEGRLRIRTKGSAGGHNGLKNIISHLGGSLEFTRVRVGVGGKPEGRDLADYVLGQFSGDDRKLMEKAEERAAQAIEALLTEPVERVMDEYNREVSFDSTNQ